MIDTMKTLTHEQFNWWLKGYLDGTKRPRIAVIKKQLDKIQSYSSPYFQWPCTTTTLPSNQQPLGTYPAPSVEITCQNT